MVLKLLLTIIVSRRNDHWRAILHTHIHTRKWLILSQCILGFICMSSCPINPDLSSDSKIVEHEKIKDWERFYPELLPEQTRTVGLFTQICSGSFRNYLKIVFGSNIHKQKKQKKKNCFLGPGVLVVDVIFLRQENYLFGNLFWYHDLLDYVFIISFTHCNKDKGPQTGYNIYDNCCFLF